ncbi:DUF4296 domain-containing protein [Bacteroidales bacterium AH-315-I05]|nr:DUF4296 domain-containing protein [Bacteroidales bacterium AH-315-I05]
MRKLLLILTVALFFSCKNDEVIISSDVISEEKMVAVLTDIQLVEAAKARNLIPGTDKITTTLEYYGEILQKHEISQQQFEDSYSVYKDHPEMLGKIYDKVLEELSKKQAEASNE